MTPRKITFKRWLHTQPNAKTPIGPEGDFIMDARDDTSFPDVRRWSELQSYLLSCNACPEAVTAAASVWHHYNAKVPA